MTARILVVDDDSRYRELYCSSLRGGGFETIEASSGDEALSMLRQEAPAMVVSDVRMPGLDGLGLLKEARLLHPELPFLLITAYADVKDAVSALKLGAVDYLAKPLDLEELLVAVRDALGLANPARLQLSIPEPLLHGVVIHSPVMLQLYQDAWAIARSDVPVLITGESGAGKEVIASFIHRAGKRASGPLVALNCGAIPAGLLASELFGHEKGAFTGADARRLGRFREANGGTLFLDEVGDLPLELQPGLLRAIETSHVTPVGSDREISVDYRLVAATNRDLESAVQEGRFRTDLFYRLNVINLHVPPLRGRSEEILPLARHFLDKPGSEKKRLSRTAAEALLAHDWPGNIRELANAMERARLLSQTEVVLPEHLPPAIRARARGVEPGPVSGSPATSVAATLDELERQAILRALNEAGGNRTRAARALGITRRGLLYKLKRMNLDGGDE